jgi:hypothetical protein
LMGYNVVETESYYSVTEANDSYSVEEALRSSSYIANMGFWAGDLDFVNNQWKDKSGNLNHATIKGGACINFINDVTITLQDVKIGETVSELNESSDDTAGVSINGSGHIEIDQSELTSAKIWQIKLSDDTEIRLTSGIGDIVFYDGNYGTLGGAEDTDWEWSTTDSAFLNLRYGCSKYAFVNNTYKRSYGHLRLYQTEDIGFELYWEGYLLEDSGVLAQVILYGQTYGYAVKYVKDSYIILSNRGAATPSFRYDNDDADLIGGYVKIRIVYNGGGYNVLGSWKLYLDGEEKTLSNVGDDGANRTQHRWAGNSGDGLKALVRDTYYKRGDELWQAVKDGRHIDIYGEAPDGYLYVPATSATDWIGQTAINPAYSDSHNGCEVKVVLPEDSSLQTADEYNYLFEAGGTAKEMDVTKFYPNLNNTIQININGNRYKDFIVMTSPENLYSTLNGLEPARLYCTFRTDTGGEGDSSSLLDYLVAQEQGISFDAHTAYPVTIGENYQSLLAASKLAISIHDIAPCFWRYATYEEGKYHYDNVATAGEKSAGTVIENQGRIGYTYGAYKSPKVKLEEFQVLLGKAWPESGAPQTDDNNEDWWEWTIEAWADHISNNGGTLAGMTSVGTLPAGLGFMFPNVRVKQLLNSYYTDSIHGKEEYNLTDDLANSNSIFSGSKNASIVEDGGVNCQKLSGASADAWGEIGVKFR